MNAHCSKRDTKYIHLALNAMMKSFPSLESVALVECRYNETICYVQDGGINTFI